MTERRAQIAFVSVVAVAAALLFVRAGSVPLLDPDESRFARSSVEMMRGGDLVVPRFEGRPRTVKPPLIHWIQSLLFRGFGVSEWTARLHAALATLGSLILVGWIAGRRYGGEGAAWAAACMATMPLVFLPGRLGTLDALLALHVLAAVALEIAEPDAAGGHRGFAVGGVLGLAFLVKGPVGLIVPLLILFAGRTAVGREILPSAASALQGLAAWCLVVLPWGVAFLRRVGLDQAEALVRGEVLDRYFAGTTHVEPPWFYLQVVVVGFLPWLAPLAVALVAALKRRRDPEARTAAYAAAAFVVVLLFFSLGKSKLPTYILPLAPLAALLVTWQLSRELGSSRGARPATAGLALTLGISAAGLGVAGREMLDGAARTTALIGAGIYGAGALVALPGWLRARPRQVFGAAALSSAAFLMVVIWVLMPGVARTRTAAYLIDAVPALSAERPLVVVEMKVPSLAFYLDRIPEVVDMVDFERRLGRDDDPVIVFDEVDLPRVPEGARRRLSEVGRQGKYLVFEKRADRPARPADAGRSGS